MAALQAKRVVVEGLTIERHFATHKIPDMKPGERVPAPELSRISKSADGKWQVKDTAKANAERKALQRAAGVEKQVDATMDEATVGVVDCKRAQEAVNTVIARRAAAAASRNALAHRRARGPDAGAGAEPAVGALLGRAP